MTKERKRYYIVEYANQKIYKYNTLDEVKEMIKRVKKYNDRKNTKFIVGNIRIRLVDDKYQIIAHLYHKLSQKTTISKIDNFTMQFNPKELESYYVLNSMTKEGYTSDINIAYFGSRNKNDESNSFLYGIRYIPVLYKGDEKYLDENFVKESLMYHLNNGNIEFFRGLASEFKYHYIVNEEVNKLYAYADKVEDKGFDPRCLYVLALRMYKKLIYELDKDDTLLVDENGKYVISERRKRDYGVYIRDYSLKYRNSPLRYNQCTTTCTKEELKHIREQLLEREEIKKLILK